MNEDFTQGYCHRKVCTRLCGNKDQEMFKELWWELGMVARLYHSGTWEAETRGSAGLRV